jgi:glycosyltransferase involved in cell wall biosynthesis
MSIKISVIICTYNRDELIQDCLRSLVNQTLDSKLYEVIVIDNNSSDNTEKVTKQFIKNLPNFRYVKEIKQGLSHARNRGYHESRGEYIAYTDDDARADKKWLEQAYNIIQEKKAEIFGGSIRPYYCSPRPKWFLDKYVAGIMGDRPRYLKKNEFLTGVNIFLKKLF